MSRGRLSAVVVAILSATLVLAIVGPAVTAAKAPPGLNRFMWAVGEVESGGSYTARNPRSGAYGKYQILPSNWPAWARQYLGNANAKPTPANQEKVAAGKFTSLYRSLDSWRRVAYWWLTGSKRTTGWSSYAKRYVNRVMRLYERAGNQSNQPTAEVKQYSENSGLVAYTGRWRTARHSGYAGDKVRYATSAGAKATITFTGRKVSWFGPRGSTRGQAHIFVDGEYVTTVDLRRRSFDARAVLFRQSFATSGKHTLTIEVVGTRGRPMVAIDGFTVVP